ncbi:LysR family transcriptional regulator [Antricoccus suffuscus]|uniref:LysR family transcriptional regulator n=1 Tax=Antricoccus suffuscus TaxID=1629062 RepID=A0A2T1A6T1_9ACTN|nr:LysR family transcriptional regulator [Antricoccus suffuscus]PRZ44309.1 LysR family transcriptional regulator [Antricoccus suffuscus]
MKLRQVEYFLAVLDHDGIHRAALALRVAQPSLSQGLQALERDLGAELFHRVGRRMIPTPAGNAFITPARRMIRDAITTRSVVASALGLSGGRLDLVGEAALLSDPVAPLIGRFRRENPNVHVRLAAPQAESSLIQMVHGGSSELGFGYLPQPLDGLQMQVIASHEFFFVQPPGTPESSEPITLDDLRGIGIIAVPRGTAQRDFFERMLLEADVRTGIPVQVAHREAVVPMILAGAGPSVLPRPRADEAVRRGAIKRRFEPQIYRKVGLFHRAGDLSPAAHALLAIAGSDT